MRIQDADAAIPGPRSLADIARDIHREPWMPVLASAACWGGGVILDGTLPPAAAIPLAAGGAVIPAALGGLAAWHRLTAAGRAYAVTAGAYATGWASLAAAGAAHGPPGAVAVAGAGLLSLPWWIRHGRTWTPEPRAVRHAERRQRTGPDTAEMMIADWREYVACPGGPLPGTALEDVAPVPYGLGADIVLHRGRQAASGVVRVAEMVASGMDRAPTMIVLEPHPSGRSSRARVTVLDRDVLADYHPYRGSRLDPATGLAEAGTFFDGQPARLRYWEPGSGATHWIVSGNTGNGKSTLVFLVIASVVDPGNPVPVVPFILDPEDGGQSTHHWQGKLKYAFNGEEQCILALRGIDAIMRQRSADMAAEGLDYFDPAPGRPLILVVLEEASAMLSESRFRDEAVKIVTRIGKRGRKRGIGFLPVTPVPALDEIESQVFRSMMRSGNVVCFRTGDPVSGGMLGLHVDPQLLPKRFADGSRAYGVCYIIGPDDRQAPLRTEDITSEQKRLIAAAAAEHPLDAASARVFAEVWNAANETAGREAETAVPAPESLGDARQRNATAATAVLRYLADGQSRMRADVMIAVRHVTTSPSTVGYALRQLVTEGLIVTEGEKKPFVITDAGRRRLADGDRGAA
jgi:hypothetical protein